MGGNLDLPVVLNPKKAAPLVEGLWEAPATIAEFASQQGFSTIYVACSGGIDSMVLADRLMAALALASSAFELCLLHVNYGLRGSDSDGDQALVKEWGSQRGVKVLVQQPGDLLPRRAAEGVQEWARRVRYDWFRELVAEGKVIALAHHRDDLAETVLLRLVRGARPGRLLGMRPLAKGIWRPFLNLTKAAIIQFATGQEIPHRHDASNDTLLYSRNLIRHVIIPELERLHNGAAKRIVDTAQEAQALQDWGDAAMVTLLPIGPILTSDVLENFPAGMAVHALSLFLRRRGARGLNRRILYRALAQLATSGASPWQEQLPSGGSIRVAGGALRFIKASEALPRSPSISEKGLTF